MIDELVWDLLESTLANDFFWKETKMIITKCAVTPIMAKEWLQESNTCNYRKPIRGVIDKYAKDMVEDRWTETTATIAFTKSGKLADGQNRLHAIVKSGKTVVMNVLHGVEESVASDANQDRGATRSLSTTVQNLGYKNATTLAAAVKTLYRMSRGLSFNLRNGGGGTSISDSATLAILDSMPTEFLGLVDSTRAKKVVCGMCTPSTLASFLWLSHCDDPDVSEEFFAIFSKELDAPSSNVANTLREHFINIRNNKQISNTYEMNLLLVAFRKFQKNTSVKILRESSELLISDAMTAELSRIASVVNRK